MKLRSLAPTRIDLAGGTVDIWPLYLFLNRATTVNLAINLFAETQLEESTENGDIHLEAADQGAKLSLPWAKLDTFQAPPALDLHLKYLKYFAAKNKNRTGKSLTLRTSAKSPAGAGLGGSSTLSVSIVGALHQWAYGDLEPAKHGESLIEITRDVETTVIKVPAGLQDYYGAMFGGLQSIGWDVSRHGRKSLSLELAKELEKRVVLFYSGQSRNSGINNWQLFKQFIDGDQKTRTLFEGIVSATHDLERALESKDWKKVGDAIASEWNSRRELASGITTPSIDTAFAKAREFGSTAGKICGAGGGGCFFAYFPDANEAAKSQAIAAITADASIRHLPYEVSLRGLELQG